jgi:hypothetical protein
VWASPDTGLVAVAGRADASALQSRIQYKTRRPVAIVSDGAEEQGYNPPYGGGMRRAAAASTDLLPVGHAAVRGRAGRVLPRRETEERLLRPVNRSSSSSRE